MSSSKIILNAASGVGGDNYWIALLGGSSGDDEFNSVAIDSNDEIVACGTTRTDGPGNRNIHVAKYNVSGDLQWNRNLGTTDGSTNCEGEGIAVDSSDNIYICGDQAYEVSGSNYIDAFLAKYNSSGTLQWQKRLGVNNTHKFKEVTVDSSDNIICVGDSTSSPDILIAKYNSSGTLQWDRQLAGSGADQSTGITTDSSDNIYISAQTTSLNDGVRAFVFAKYNSSGTFQFQKTRGKSGVNAQGKDIIVDSSGNIYMTGYSNVSGNFDAHLIKFNSSGTLQWERSLGGSGAEFFWGLCFDSSGDIIIGGYSNTSGTAGNYDACIAKYNSSGTLQFQKLIGTSAAERVFSIKTDSNDDIIFCGNTSGDGTGAEEAMLVKMRGDGTGDGTFGSWTVQDASLTSSTPSLAAPASLMSDAAIALNENNGTLTEAAGSLTDETISI